MPTVLPTHQRQDSTQSQAYNGRASWPQLLLPHIVITVLCIAAPFQTGCTSQPKEGKRLSGVREFFLGPMDIPYWVDRFWERKGRLPQDYAELTTYVAKRTNGKVRLENYPRVDFQLLTTGQRQATFYTVENGSTNIANRVAWGKPRGLE